jgi:hypothetical protein
MDNDTLINQARNLYAVLEVLKSQQSVASDNRIAQLKRMVINANVRYQRRLNHCVLCYFDRSGECLQNCFRKNGQVATVDIQHPHALCSD